MFGGKPLKKVKSRPNSKNTDILQSPESVKPPTTISFPLESMTEINKAVKNGLGDLLKIGETSPSAKEGSDEKSGNIGEQGFESVIRKFHIDFVERWKNEFLFPAVEDWVNNSLVPRIGEVMEEVHGIKYAKYENTIRSLLNEIDKGKNEVQRLSRFVEDLNHERNYLCHKIEKVSSENISLRATLDEIHKVLDANQTARPKGNRDVSEGTKFHYSG